MNGQYPAASKVHVSSIYFKPITATTVDEKTGKFEATFVSPLHSPDTVTVEIDGGDKASADVGKALSTLPKPKRCGIPSPEYPCVNAPKETDDSVTGEVAKLPDGNYPEASALHLETSYIAPEGIGPATIDKNTGKFTFQLKARLGSGTVKVKVDGVGDSGDVSIVQAASTKSLCAQSTKSGSSSGKSGATDGSSGAKGAAPADTSTVENAPAQASKFCVNQPTEDDTSVSGTFSPPGKFTVYFNNQAQSNLDIQTNETKKTFTISGLPRLSPRDKLQIIEATAGEGAKTLDTGLIPIKAASNLYNVGLSIPATSQSLDFGHQAMETQSAAKQVTITNTTDKPITIVDPSTTITDGSFRVNANSCPDTLQPKGTCTFQVVYAPFQPPKIPGQAETAFIVFVPKFDGGAIDKYNAILNAVVNAPAAQATLSSARRTLSSSTNRQDLSAALSKLQSVSFPAAAESSESEAASFDQSGALNLSPHSGVVDCGTLGDKKISETVTAKCRDQLLALTDSANSTVRSLTIAQVQELEKNFQVVALSGVPDHWKYPLTRAVVGIDLSAPSSQSVKQAYFVEFDLLAPLALPGVKRNQDALENRLWVWFNPRITSLPQGANFSALSTINETGSFLDSETSKGTLGDIQGLDLSGGFDIAIIKPRDAIPWWGEYVNTQARLAPSFIVGGGMSTPFSTSNTDIFSQVTPAICDAYNAIPPAGKPPNPIPTFSTAAGLICGNTGPSGSPANQTFIIAPAPTPTNPLATKNDTFIDFYTPQRSRFFRKYYAGFRLKTYFFSKAVQGDCDQETDRPKDKGDCDGLYDIFPGIIDITLGKDEAVTHGLLQSWLLRVDAVYPLPWYQGIHLFASAYTALKSNTPYQPYNSYSVLTPAAGMQTDYNTFRFGIRPLDRDYFRIGIGIDLIQAFKKKSSGGQPNKDAPAPSQTPAPISSTGKSSPGS